VSAAIRNSALEFRHIACMMAIGRCSRCLIKLSHSRGLILSPFTGQLKKSEYESVREANVISTS
jgi:hypothetical protein